VIINKKGINFFYQAKQKHQNHLLTSHALMQNRVKNKILKKKRTQTSK